MKMPHKYPLREFKASCYLMDDHKRDKFIKAVICKQINKVI